MPHRRNEPSQLDFFVLRDAPTRARASGRQTKGIEPAAASEDLQGLANRLPPDIRLGTSSWSFPGWAGIVYGETTSKQRLARLGLAAYARHPLLRTVGIDRTFYAPVAAAALARYAAAVPDDFRFLMKAHEACTIARYADHPRYGNARGKVNDLFLNPAYAADEVVGPFVQGLADKGGPLLFQFPPQDVGAAGGPAAFIDRLHQFLDALPKGPVYCIEVRDPRLLTTAYREVLRATGASHCFNAHPTMPDVDAQAQRVGTEFPATVVRWMLGRGFEYEEARQRYDPFDRIVDDDPSTRAAIAARCVASARSRRPAYVIINNKAEGSAPLSAFGLAASIAALVEEV